jgi:hypothetical protein
MPPPSFSPDLPRPTPSLGDAVARIKGMFLEMPGTEWTLTDAARLSGLERSVCQAILEALKLAGFLSQRSDGAYGRSLTPPRAPVPSRWEVLESLSTT